MKKLILCSIVFVLLAFPALADEGMWIPMLLKKYNIEDMQQAGFKLTAEDMVKILQSEQGAKKDVQHRDFYVILNQADDDKILQSAEKIAAVLSRNGIKTAVNRYY